ncbi:hypothetical protein [Labedella endophytica]|uniref:Iron ABC transporter ATP-binding protein n=1 Tax=Labedella endophytica TaxID=1523160 RepID=A0A433JTC6_9MICO|nr:hypothetical protein [Labedella endophytica]RUR01174.1 hypothetical protein ELQ94_06540 [Labedella endophytica]
MTASALPRVRTVLFTALVVGSLGLLSGCAPEPGPTSPTDSPSATASPSITAPGGTEQPSGEPTEPAELPDLGEAGPECGDVLSDDDIYAYNPNFSAVASPTPASDSLLERAASLDGTTCRWVNNSSGEALDIAVAVPGETELAELRDEAESSATPAPALSDPPAVEAYFDRVGDVGTGQVFADGRWIVLSDAAFLEAGDLEELVATVLANVSAA